MHITEGGLKIPKLFKKSAETKTVADELLKSYKEALKKCEDPHQLKILYLQLCWHKPFYGSVFFKGIMEKPSQYLKMVLTNEKHVVVAINMECVHLMSASWPTVSECIPKNRLSLIDHDLIINQEQPC